jgi:hypothetical protein
MSEAVHNYYVVDKKVYDLKDWIPIHPGGTQWFLRSFGRDITSIVYTYHNNMEMIKKILVKYETNIPMEKILDPCLNVPRFLLPEDFDLKRDTLTFDFQTKDTLLEKTRRDINAKEMKAKLTNADLMYDLTGFAIFAFHCFMSFYGIYYEVLPPWLLCFIFLCTRTSMASIGHYHCHRRKDGIADWGDGLFDLQYVGASPVTFEGHVMIHHTQTNSAADPKRTVFTGLLELPRLYRVPAETVRRWAHAMTGMTVRWLTIVFFEKGATPESKYRIA